MADVRMSVASSFPTLAEADRAEWPSTHLPFHRIWGPISQEASTTVGAEFATSSVRIEPLFEVEVVDAAIATVPMDHSSGLTRASCYECDDKCGSQWCELPVASGGRDNKECAKAKFKFGIQCNTVAGGGGVNRFMVVPKHIKTGGNFGLTCFILALWSAHRHGRLTPSAGRTIYRHTDGGPDNLNKATHLFH